MTTLRQVRTYHDIPRPCLHPTVPYNQQSNFKIATYEGFQSDPKTHHFSVPATSSSLPCNLNLATTYPLPPLLSTCILSLHFGDQTCLFRLAGHIGNVDHDGVAW